jgi:hypothetical protein
MDTIVYGNLGQGLEVVSREGRYFVRYDAGSHLSAWREDEITEFEFHHIRCGGQAEHAAILNLQRRLEEAGINPYQQNWTPT